MTTRIFEIFPSSPNLKDLEKVAQALQDGAVIIYPTDTVYALGCLSTHKEALEKFAQLKEVKIEKAPLSFLFNDLSELSKYVKPFDARIFRLLKRCLPGPYAFIMKATNKLPKPFQKRKTIGVRISDHPVLKVLLPLLKAPLITSSLHDQDRILIYTSDPNEIISQWDEKVDLIIHSGAGGNVPSTVIDLTGEPYELVRQGKGESFL